MKRLFYSLFAAVLLISCVEESGLDRLQVVPDEALAGKVHYLMNHEVIHGPTGFYDYRGCPFINSPDKTYWGFDDIFIIYKEGDSFYIVYFNYDGKMTYSKPYKLMVGEYEGAVAFYPVNASDAPSILREMFFEYEPPQAKGAPRYLAPRTINNPEFIYDHYEETIWYDDPTFSGKKNSFKHGAQSHYMVLEKDGKLGSFKVGDPLPEIKDHEDMFYDEYRKEDLYYAFSIDGKPSFTVFYQDSTVTAIQLEPASGSYIMTYDGYYIGYPARDLFNDKPMTWANYYEGETFAFKDNFVFGVDSNDLKGGVDIPDSAGDFESSATISRICYQFDHP